MMKEVTYSQAICEALREEMLRDEAVFVMGEDVALLGGPFGATKGLYAEFGPRRVKGTPISEAAIAGSGVGAAMCGCRPVVELMYIDFTPLASDQIINQAAKMRYMSGGKLAVPLVIRTQGGSGKGAAGQHSQSLESWYCHIPGLKVAMPSSPYEAKGLLKTAIRDDNPVMFIEHKLLYFTKGQIPEEEYTIDFGKAAILREGSDVTVIAISYMVQKALAGAEALQKEGIDAEVIDPRTLVPLDEETIINSVRKTGKAVIVHEACKRGGFSAEIASVIMEKAFDYLDCPVARVAGANTPIPFNANLEKRTSPDENDIIRAVKATVKGEEKSEGTHVYTE